MFDYKPQLSGILLSLNPLLPTDFEGLYEIANDPLMWAQHPAKDRYKREIFTQYFEQAIASDTALVARDSETKNIIGTSRYHGLDQPQSEIEIGWSFLARSHWGGAYNKEMKDLMLKHAFQWVETVILVIGEDNIRSQRAAEKIGGVLRNSSLTRGDLVNVVFTIHRDDYLTGQSARNT